MRHERTGDYDRHRERDEAPYRDGDQKWTWKVDFKISDLGLMKMDDAFDPD